MLSAMSITLLIMLEARGWIVPLAEACWNDWQLEVRVQGNVTQTGATKEISVALNISELVHLDNDRGGLL